MRRCASVSASPSPAAARRAAAAGLFSSCASPAERRPSAVSFSCCWSRRVVSRTRSVIRNTSRGSSSGTARSISGNRSRRTRTMRTVPKARAVPTYSVMREKGRTPEISPGRARKITSSPASRRRDLHLPVQDQHHGVRRVAAGEDHLAVVELHPLPVLREPGELLRGEVGQERDLRQPRGLRLQGPHSFARYGWTRETAMAPSPTPDATRFTEPARTSPAANTPGTLASRR